MDQHRCMSCNEYEYCSVLFACRPTLVQQTAHVAVHMCRGVARITTTQGGFSERHSSSRHSPTRYTSPSPTPTLALYRAQIYRIHRALRASLLCVLYSVLAIPQLASQRWPYSTCGNFSLSLATTSSTPFL